MREGEIRLLVDIGIGFVDTFWHTYVQCSKLKKTTILFIYLLLVNGFILHTYYVYILIEQCKPVTYIIIICMDGWKQ